MSAENITELQQEIISKFSCERLSSSELNINLLSNFSSSHKQGKSLISYLFDNGWNEDITCRNAYYLIKDGDGEVVLFFSLKCGTLFSPFDKKVYSSKVNSFRDVMSAFEILRKGNTDKNRKHARSILERYRVDNMDIKETIRQIIYDGEAAKNALAHFEDDKNREANINIHRVSETYPAIEIVHFCVNDNLREKWKSYHLNHPMGEVMFWHLIVPLICKMQEYVGCQYVFLFAANLSENASLINYYNVALKFQLQNTVTTNKPCYDFSCYDFCCTFMCQEIKDLKKHRENYFAHFNIDTDTP